MNISPIAFFSTINPYKNIKETSFKPSFSVPFRGVGLTSDVFEKENDDNSLKKYYAKALRKFKNEAEEYILNSPTITYEGLNEIIEKYSLNTKVEPFVGKNYLSKKSNARYEEDLTHTGGQISVKETIDSRKILVSIPGNLDKTLRVNLLECFVHEAVHMFQNETRVEVLGETFIKQFYKNPESINKNTIKAIDDLGKGFEKFEENLFILLEGFLNSINNPESATIENFDNFIQKNHNIDFKNTVILLLESAYYETGENIIKTLGKDTIIDFAKYKAQKELEAYTNGNEIISKYSNDNFKKMNSKMSVLLYQELINVLNVLDMEYNP